MRFTIAALALVTAGLAQADTTYNTDTSWQGGYSTGYDMVAQRFFAPTNGDKILNDYSFRVTYGGDVNFSIVPWNYEPTGPAVFSRDFLAQSDLNTVTGINVALTPGGRYAAIVNVKETSSRGVGFMGYTGSYPQGSASFHTVNYGGAWLFENYGYNTAFVAHFSAVPEPASMAVLGVGALAVLRRRKRA